MKKTPNKIKEFMEMAGDKKVLLVFLRHFGCTFCRETMTRLAEAKDEIEWRDTEIVVVHMVPYDTAERLLNIYELEGINHISDPNLELYQHFGLNRATFNELFNPRNWWRAFKSGIIHGHLFGKPAGNTYQMPGIFLFYKQKILNKFTYKYVSDMPDFLKLISLP